ncbi:collagen-like protein [Streptomyces sp. ok210]|uniref:collagen-like triple helix repeat-containing protein n=1 Tax=Streptomyces sp. ok210 TaxID=1761905 RepID=UPI0008E83F92|nr:collagen-like protein [Streptomyces sp. ok210]SFT31830.1 hypothetical protein SAMN04487982_12446 [Streptomyces sp. ok210]
MPFPDGTPVVTLTGTLPSAVAGDGYGGQVLLTPSAILADSERHAVYPGGGKVAIVDGQFSVELIPNDAVGVDPDGWKWQVDVQPSKGRRVVFWADIHGADGDTVHLDELVPAQAPGGGSSGNSGGDGAPGKSAYEIAVQQGFAGTVTQWLASLSGPAGPTGAAGAQGPKGDTGAPGPQGAQGNTGATGPQPQLGAAGAGDTIALKTTDPSTTNARSPLAHAASHGSGGSDPISPAAIGAEPTGTAASAVAALSALTQTSVKPADETRTATTTLADDQHLYATLDVNSTYRFRSTLLFDGPEAGDATITFTAPTGASGGWSPFAGTLGTTVPDGSAQIKVAARQLGSPSDVGVMASSASLAGIMLLPQGVVTTGATPGQLRLRWAQQTSSATPTSLKAGSNLEVVKLSGPTPAASGINNDFPSSYPSDQGLLAWTYDPDEAGHVTAQSAAGVAGRVTLTKIMLRKQVTWSTIWLGLSGVDAAATLSNCYLGVYDTTGTLKGVTADLSSTFVNASNAKAIALSLTAPFTAAPGQYFIAMLLNGSWATNVFHFKCSSAGISVNANLTPPNLRYSNMLSGQTSLPASIDLTQQTVSLINTGWASQWYAIT